MALESYFRNLETLLALEGRFLNILRALFFLKRAELKKENKKPTQISFFLK